MNATLPRSRLEWMLAALLALVIVAALSACAGILLAMLGIAPLHPWNWLARKDYQAGAFIATLVGLWLLFRWSLRE